MKFRPSRLRARLAPMAAALLVGVSTATAAVVGSGTANAAPEGASTIVTRDGLVMTADVNWTNIQFVPPLDNNVFTREWFHDGSIGFNVSGPGADKFKGTLKVGYQVGYPFSTGTVSVEVNEDQIGSNLPGGRQGNGFGGTYTFGIGYGPGIADVSLGTVDVSGTSDGVEVHAWHGTVSGVIGQVHIRPYVTLVSEHGDYVTAFGKIWDH